MYEVGDLVTYGPHGVCKIKDMSEETFGEITKSYYILHPVNQPTLTIYCPVDSDLSTLKDIVSKEQAKIILECFTKPTGDWIERPTTRYQAFNSILKTSNPLKIAAMANTLTRKEMELESEGKKLGSRDIEILMDIRQVLFKELALALDTTPDEVSKHVEQLISGTIGDSTMPIAE
ncbi:CarD family transcriptional regulator [Sporosarcina thermotolerans]|uniref:CarD family transcriptional regulator n=1 Tax=Sporosarcina thermotolerans TaxID=633404 RepID=A0AAW9AA27_9BACL|nr:CarD family transcriptional regulator [Sporosarcina thermotolerans]MDW0116533.1 CarD family transcriptional regulator [Sporosarcina thermotolerans]WHT48755.1 CarD family transcriptional regulator [Sporosarcina thermotolerans]